MPKSTSLFSLNSDPVAQINIVANEMICSCHALCQGRTNARFLVQGLFEKAYFMDHSDVSDQQAKNLI